MATRWMLGSVLCLGLAACGSSVADEAGDDPVTLDEASTLEALQVNEDGSDEQLADPSEDAPDVDRDCSLSAAKARLVARYDQDHDGSLDADELKALREDFGDGFFRFRHAVRQARRELWKRVYDADQNGKLDDAERATLRGDLEARCENRKQYLLETYDANHDGRLDDTEWSAFAADVRARWEERRAKLLQSFDHNHDGRLEPGERLDAREALRDRVEDKWKAERAQFDTNGDGKLDGEERAGWVAELRSYVRGEHFGER